MAKVPAWAYGLVATVLKDEGAYDIVKLCWRRGSNGLSSGRTFSTSRRIVVTAGRGRTDQKLVLLHELAHILTPKENHSPKFWDKAWTLYQRYGVPMAYAQKREFVYKAGARASYKRIIGKRALRLSPPKPHRHAYRVEREELFIGTLIVHRSCVCGAYSALYRSLP